MPTFQITGPDGKKYRVTGDNAEGALAALRKSQGATEPAAPEAPAAGVLEMGKAAALGAADTASFSFGDELGARLGAVSEGLASYITGKPGRSYDELLGKIRQQDKDAQAEAPGSYLTGQIAGAFALPGAAVKSVPQAIAQGAAQGAAYGFGSGEGDIIDRAEGAGYGAFAGGAAGGAVHKVAEALMSRAARASIPSTEAIKDTARAGYKLADDAKVVVKDTGVQALGSALKNDLRGIGYHPTLHPKVGAVLDDVDRLGQAPASFEDVNNLRKIAKNVADSTDPSEARIGAKLVGRIEDYMENLPANDVASGNAQQAAEGFRQGQENWARFRRSEMVDTEAVKAARRAATSGTGGNVENTMRQNVRKILDNPRRSRGMTADELAAAERVVAGTGTQNALRLAGRFSPTTGGLSAMLNVGATAANPMLAIPGLLGAGAKALADRGTMKNVQALSEVIRSGGQDARQMVAQALIGQGAPALVNSVQRISKGDAVASPGVARIAALLANLPR